MNIAAAKTKLKEAVSIYLRKDELGRYVLAQNKQRPIFLYGPPGLGKTEIVQQVAAENNIGLVSYSITHHTRQSAIGLPSLEKKIYGGKEVTVSEYTVSEIIASVYEMIEIGYTEGILFLDEANCISETIRPIMLGLYQAKKLGQHSIPEGWIIVTAGNPVEYNKAAGDFDTVTLDRIEKIELTPDYRAWKDYAIKNGVHGAVIAYLESKDGHDFYNVCRNDRGYSVVTPRGWEDVSNKLKEREYMGYSIDFRDISPIIQNDAIANRFMDFYNTYIKYKDGLDIPAILEGNASDSAKITAKNMIRSDERISFVSMLADSLIVHLREVQNSSTVINKINFEILPRIVSEIQISGKLPLIAVDEYIAERLEMLEKAKTASSLKKGEEYIVLKGVEFLRGVADEAKKSGAEDAMEFTKIFQKRLESKNKENKTKTAACSRMIKNAITFCEEAEIPNESGMDLFVTLLITNDYSAGFLGANKCEEFAKYSKIFRSDERRKLISNRITSLEGAAT